MGGPRDGTRVSDYDYPLPCHHIAQYPCDRRDQSRLMVLGADGGITHRHFADVRELIRPGDLLVVNESRVIPARLLGRKPTGAPSEVLLVRPAEPMADSEGPGSARLWEALVRPGGKLKPGREIIISDELIVRIEDSIPGGGRVVRLDTPLTTAEVLDRYGHVPLPPYIDRDDEPLDRERYQTVYARDAGSVAAPTAGLHFTSELLAELAELGVARTEIILHVGVGTFRPVEVEDPAEHDMHDERFSVSAAAARAIAETKAHGGRVWAVGTTVVRTLESTADGREAVAVGGGSTRLFIRPPFDFRVVDGLLTNFHLPRSTLLMLVAAFAGYDRVMDAYREAVAQGYRMYSYGDAMLVEPSQ